MNIDFSRKLIKGRIAEVVFEQMIREEDRYTIIPFGYEHTMPTLAQYRQHFAEIEEIIANISDAPDFALVSKDNTKIYLVEVKYQKSFDIDEIKKYCEKLLSRWKSPWIFIATPIVFYCAPCSSVLKNSRISELPESWVVKERQVTYLKLLNEFEK